MLADIEFELFHFQEPRLGDMLEYIEARNKVLDEEGTDASPEPDGAVAAQQFMSLIKFNGVPILPPVVSFSF